MNRRSFVERVRNGNPKVPTQPGFRVERWTSSFSEIKSPSISEQRLHDSGVWFASKFEQVRNLLAQYEGIRIPSDRTVQAHVGAANWMIRNDTRLYQEGIGTSVQGGAGEAGASAYSPGAYPAMQLHSLIEGFVTSLRFAFEAAIRESQQPLESGASEGVEALTKIRIRLQAGTIYDLLYYLWNECLWNDWYVDTSGEADLIIPDDTGFAVACAIGERRWAELGTELFLRVAAGWRRLTSEQKSHFVSMPRVTDLVQEAEGQRIVTGTGDAASPHAPIEFITQVASTELYFGDLLSEELPMFPGLCIKHLTSAWVSLAPLADIVSARFPEHGYIDTLGQILEYSPTFERSHLEGVLIAAMRITNDQAKQILDLLTFSHVREELWLKPLVYGDEDRVAVLTSALRAPNLLRSVEQWMKIGDLDLDRRGGAFERFVRERLAQSNTLSSFEILQRPFTLDVEDTGEEIDLVARIGSTFIVGEVKCSIHPTEPMQVHRYFDDRLHSGAAQAARKAEFVRTHFDTFLSQASFTDVGVEDARVIPVVLTNLTLGVGHSFDGVPVVDLLILQRFIDEGVVTHNGYFNKEGELVVEREEKLYASEAEAETAIEEYLRNPPQLRMYKSQVAAEPTPIASISEDDKPAYFVNLFSARPGVEPLT